MTNTEKLHLSMGMTKEAFGGALVGHVAKLFAKSPWSKALGQKAVGGFGKAWTRTGELFGKAMKTIGDYSASNKGINSAREAARYASGASKKAPAELSKDLNKFQRWGQSLTEKSQRGRTWSQGHLDEANKHLDSITGWKGKGMRLAGGAAAQAGWIAPAIVGGPSLTPGMFAFDQAMKVPDFLANQQRQGAARAMSMYNDLPMYQRLAAAAMPGMAEGRLQQMDPKMFEYYQKFQQQRV